MIVLDTSALVEFLVGSDPLADAVRAATKGQRLAADLGGEAAAEQAADLLNPVEGRPSWWHPGASGQFADLHRVVARYLE